MQLIASKIQMIVIRVTAQAGRQKFGTILWVVNQLLTQQPQAKPLLSNRVMQAVG